MVMSAATVVCRVVYVVVVTAPGAVVIIAVPVVIAATDACFTVLLPPLVTGAAAIPVAISTDKETEPCPTIVVPLVRVLPSW